MDFQKFDSMTEEEMAENFDKMDPVILDKLNEADRKFMKVHQATRCTTGAAVQQATLTLLL